MVNCQVAPSCYAGTVCQFIYTDTAYKTFSKTDMIYTLGVCNLDSTIKAGVQSYQHLVESEISKTVYYTDKSCQTKDSLNGVAEKIDECRSLSNGSVSILLKEMVTRLKTHYFTRGI